MSVPMLFVISSPRSGSTMLERILEAHENILGGPESHLLTPLAHLGVWDNVEKAPYDHVLAAESQQLFIDRLPNTEQDYWDACRAYCDTLYGRLLETHTEATMVLDKTPAYGLILPFMMKVFPDAKFVVLTRHPLAIFSSYANSFFDGDYQVAQDYNPLLNRYVPAIATFLRQTDVPFFHIKYEDLVTDPESWMEKIYDYVGLPFDADTINYGDKKRDDESAKGLGDPIGVKQHNRPSASHIHKWVEELATDGAKLALMEKTIRSLDPEDLETFGYPIDDLWQPLDDAADREYPPRPAPKLDRYRLQRKTIIYMRGFAQRNPAFRKLLKTMRLGADVLLREQ